VQAAEAQAGPTAEDLGDDCRDDRPRRLAGAIGVEWPDDGDRHSERGKEAVSDCVRRDLACTVRGLRLQRMVFVDRHVARRAVDFARRGVKKLRNADFARRLQQVERAGHVGRHIAARRDIGVRDGDERGQVNHDVHIGHEFAHEMRIANVAADDFDPVAAADVVEPTQLLKELYCASARTRAP